VSGKGNGASNISSGLQTVHEGETRSITAVIKQFELSGDDVKAALLRSLRELTISVKEARLGLDRLCESGELSVLPSTDPR